MSPSAFSNVTFDPARQATPATVKAVKGQKRSHQGAYVFKVDDMERARRFLILGSESSFYQAGAKLSMENAKTLRKLARSDRALELLDLIVDISVQGRAPKQGPGLFALAVLISQSEDQEVKNAGYLALPKVARTASTLFEFLGYLQQFQNITGMGVRKAIARWYNERDVDKLAYQMVKYRQRDRYTHTRMLRISKRVKSEDRPELNALLDWAVGKAKPENFSALPKVVKGFEYAKDMEPEEVPDVIRDFGLSWEMIPTERLNDRKVWDALLDSGNLPMGALIRQLPRLTNLGIIAPLGGRTNEIAEMLRNTETLKKARIHPLKALVAMRTYSRGYGTSQKWTPNPRITDALEDAFYETFQFVEPTNKRWMLALDLSASMNQPIAGMPITAREAEACMAMVTARTEPEHMFVGFTGRNVNSFSGTQLMYLDITAKSRLNDVVGLINQIPFGGTDLSLPMEAAIANNLEVDTFAVYTDNENGYGSRHPFQALQAYREHSGIDAKFVVAAMTATNFSIANPEDAGMMDVVGFDTAAPALMADFAR